MAFERAVDTVQIGARKVRDVYAVEGASGVARRARKWLRKRQAGGTNASLLPLGPLPQPVTWHPHVLSVAERSLAQCYHYRVQQKREICEHLDVPFDDLPITDVEEVLVRLQLASILIVYRLPGGPALERILAEAARLHVPVIYEVDDLVYRREVTADNPNLHTLPSDLKAAVIRSSDGYMRALTSAEYNLASTPALVTNMSEANGRPGFFVENGIDAMMLEIAEGLTMQPGAWDDVEGVVVTYGSGSRAHDHDFLLVAPALARWLHACPEGRLKLLGPVRLPEMLRPFEDRILRRTDVLAYGEYLRELRNSSISIAPLTNDVFNAFKSQVKYLESALVGVPFVASPMVYSDYVQDGRTGIIARDEQGWFDALVQLGDDPQRRRDMAAAAREDVRQWELANKPSEQMRSLITSVSPVSKQVVL